MVVSMVSWCKMKHRQGLERRFRRRRPNPNLVLLTLPFLILMLGAAHIRSSYSEPKDILNPFTYDTSTNVVQSSDNNVRLLMVVLAIPNGYPNLAKIAGKSHAAYAKRHGYRLHIETLSESGDIRAASLQKLLACRRAKGEKYVLVLDYDVVIAPWAPPIHLDEQVLEMNQSVGIVDESQPSDAHVRAVLLRRNGREREATAYYHSFGYTDIFAPNGILNTGVLLLQPEFHGDWFEQIYYRHLKAQIASPAKFHYEQAMIGAELIRNDSAQLLSHAWNRNWVWYNWSEAVGFEKYEIGEVFSRSYFMHFCWTKEDMPKLEHWMDMQKMSFEPREYAHKEELLP